MSPQTKVYTYEEFLQISMSKEERIEFINGEIYCQATPTLKHQRIVGRVYAKLLNYFNGRDCEPFIAPFDIVFEGQNYKERVQPDVFVICGDKNIDENEYKGIPSLIIEVLSPSNANWDYVKKMDLYARFGVKEYWIVSPVSQSIQVFEFQESGYAEPMLYSKEDIVKSNIFEKLFIPLKEIFTM